MRTPNNIANAGTGKVLFSSALFLIFIFSFGTSRADITGAKLIYGQCNPDSHIAEGNINEDLRKRHSRFYCDNVSVGYFDNVGKHILLNFGESKSHTGIVIGFAGYMNTDGRTMDVENVYIGNERFQVQGGGCKFWFDQNKNIKDILCGAPVEVGDRKTVPVISFSANKQDQSKPIVGKIPSSIAIMTNSEGEDIYLTNVMCKSPSGVPLNKLKIMHKYIHNQNVDDGCYAIENNKVTAIWYGSQSTLTYDLSQFNFNK